MMSMPMPFCRWVARTCALAAMIACIPMLPSFAISAQDAETDSGSGRSWTLTTWLQGAYQIPVGRLASSPAVTPELAITDAVADLRRSFLASADVEIGFPARDMAVRLGVEATMGAEAAGMLGICDLLTGELCVPEVAPTALRGISAQVIALRGNPEWPVRPLVGGGVGWRQYSFALPNCRGRDTPQHRSICNLLSDFFRRNGSHLIFRGLAGLRATKGRYLSELTGSLGTGKFNGGTSRVNGGWYADIRIALSGGIRVL